MTYKGPLIIGAAALLTVWGMKPIWKQNDGQVLAEKTQIPPLPAITVTPTLAPSPTPSPTIKPKPSPVPTPTVKPQPKYSSEEIYHLINQYAAEKGVSADVIRHIAICETGFRPDARNGIYAGLFQYDAPTWKSFRTMMGADPDPDLRYNAKEAIKTTVYLVSLGKQYLWPNCHP